MKRVNRGLLGATAVAEEEASMRVWPVLLALVWSAAAQPAEPDPAAPVHALAEAVQALPSPVTAEALETPIGDQFDLQRFAEAALAEHAKAASVEQLGRLARISARRLAVDMIEQWPDETPSWSVTEARALEAGGWLVTTVSQIAGQEPQTLQWRITEAADRLRIADIAKAGTSYAATFGREIERALRTRTLDAVLSQLEQRYGLAGEPR